MIVDERPRQPSILTVYRPIEEFWSASGLERSLGTDPETALDPLDALLVHVVLDLIPDRPTLVDLAAGATAGASSLLGLMHPGVRRVIGVGESGATATAPERQFSALRAFLRLQRSPVTPFEVCPAAALTERLRDQRGVVILADARHGDAAALASRVESWLDAAPEALVLLLGLGRIGDCPAAEALVRACGTGTPRRLWLIRELGEVLAASHLGLVARRDQAHAGDILLRLQLQYEGNFGFIDLLKAVDEAAMRAAGIDEEVMRVHPSTGPLRMELEALRQSAECWRAQAEEAGRAIAALTAQRDALVWVECTPFRQIVRRKLAPGVLGKLYRRSKQVLRGRPGAAR